MAMKKTTTKTDYTPYKATAAFALLFISLVAISRLSKAYALIDSYDIFTAAFRVAAVAFFALAAAALIVYLAVKKPRCRQICRYVFVLALLEAVCAAVFAKTWISNTMTLYFLQAVVYCLYIIWLLYQAEFFTFSLATCFAGYVFYAFSKGRNFLLAAALLVLLVLIALFVRSAAKSKGIIKVGKKKFRVFPASFNPAILLIACGLWLVCLILALVLGSTFAYYCMFAALAFELIAAVYYTFQLK